MVSTLVTVPVWQVAAFESSRVADRLFHLLMPAVMPILMLWSFIGFSIKFYDVIHGVGSQDTQYR